MSNMFDDITTKINADSPTPSGEATSANMFDDITNTINEAENPSNVRLEEIKAAGDDFQVGSQLYEGTKTLAQQEEIYEYLKAKGGNKGGVFRDNVDGQAIPMPSKSKTTDTLGSIPFIGGIAEGVVEGFNHYEGVIGNEIMDVSTEAVSFVTGLVDQVGQIVGHDPELSKKWDDVNSSHTTEGTVDTLVGEGAKLAISAAVTAGPSLVIAGGSKVAAVVNAAWKVTKIDAIYAMTSDKEQEVGIMRFVKNVTGDSEWGMQKDLSEKMNVFIDSMLLAGVFKVAGMVVSKPYGAIKNKVINPIVTALGFGKEYMDREAMEEILFNALKELPEGMSDQKVIQILSKRIKENLEDIIPSEGGDIVIENTTGQAINRAASDEAAEITERIAVLKESGGNAKEIAALERDKGYYTRVSKEALNLERSSLGKRTASSPQLTSKLEGQKRILTEDLEEGNKAYGGYETTEILKDELTSSVKKQTDEAFGLAESHAVDVASLKNEIQGLSKESDFFKVLEEVETSTGINIAANVDKNIDKVKSVLKKVYYEMADTQKAKYAAAEEATNKITLPADFFEYINSNKGVISKELLGKINAGDMAAGTIIKRVNQELSAAIEKDVLHGTTERDVINSMVKLKEMVTKTYPEAFKNSTNDLEKEAGRLSIEATDYARDHFNSYWNQGEIAELGKDFKKSRVNPNYPEMNKDRIATSEKTSREKVVELHSARSRELGPVMEEILLRGGSVEDVGAVLKSQAALKLLSKMEDGKTIDNLTSDEIRLAFRDIIAQNPKLEAQLDPFYAEFKRLKGDLTEQTHMLEVAVEGAKEVEDRLQGKVFREWFNKNAKGFGYDVDPKSGASIVASIMEKSESSVKTLANIVDRMTEEGNTMAIKGLQSGYYRFLRKKFVGNDGLMDVKAVNDLLNNSSNIRQELEVLFPDNNKTVQTTLLILENISSKRVIEAEVEGMMRVHTKSDNYIQDTAMQAVNAGITYTWGILNPTAAKARIAARYASKFRNPGTRYLHILDTVYANPQEFSLILDEAYKNGTDLSSEGKKLLTHFFYKGLIHPSIAVDETEEAMTDG